MFRNEKNLVMCAWSVRQVREMRRYGDCPDSGHKKGLVIGAYDGCNPGDFKLTTTGEKFDDELGGKIREHLRGAVLKKGNAIVFSNLCNEFVGVAVAGLGSEEASFNDLEILDEAKENIRCAAGAGAVALQDRSILNIFVEGFGCAEAAAEGASLGVWKYQEFKRQDTQTGPAKLELFDDPDREGWKRGVVKGDAQNIARKLEETPANLMTPRAFSQKSVDLLCPCGIQVDVRDRDWLETKKMAPFLSIARSSCEPPLLAEVSYCGGNLKDKPVVVVGKGVTFDSGGLNLRSIEGLQEGRADMAGAAVVVAIFRAIATMSLPINLIGLIPLCESMPGGMSVKPGDVVMGLNGKTIRLDDTDHEGRVIMADAISYSKAHDPCLVCDIATMTGATKKSLGRSASACFCTSDCVWKELQRAGAETGDRFWRLPIWKHFTDKITDYIGVDVNNVGKTYGGGACLAAAFLLEFVPKDVDFAHVDITGTGMLTSGAAGFPYLRPGLMTGRPVRTLAQFLYQMGCPHEKPHEA